MHNIQHKTTSTARATRYSQSVAGTRRALLQTCNRLQQALSCTAGKWLQFRTQKSTCLDFCAQVVAASSPPSLPCGSAPTVIPCRSMTAEQPGVAAAYACTAASVNSAAWPCMLSGLQQPASSVRGLLSGWPYTASELDTSSCSTCKKLWQAAASASSVDKKLWCKDSADDVVRVLSGGHTKVPAEA
jgi:hypothetical protein